MTSLKREITGQFTSDRLAGENNPLELHTLGDTEEFTNFVASFADESNPLLVIRCLSSRRKRTQLAFMGDRDIDVIPGLIDDRAL